MVFTEPLSVNFLQAEYACWRARTLPFIQAYYEMETVTSIFSYVPNIVKRFYLVTDVLEDVDVEPLDVLVPPVLVPLLAVVPVLHLKLGQLGGEVHERHGDDLWLPLQQAEEAL